MKKLTYIPHQRDYTVLATSVVIDAYTDEACWKYFSYQVNPFFIYIKDGVLWHFMAEEDARGVGLGWVKTHGTLAKLKQQKRQQEALLRSYHKFVRQKHADPKVAITRLHAYFHDALPFIVACISVPEYASNKISPAILALFMQSRKQVDDFYRVGIELQTKLLQRIAKGDKLPSQILAYLSGQEFQSYMESGKLPTLKHLRARKRYFVLQQGKGILRYTTARSGLKRFGLSLPKASVGPLHGSVAFPGEAKGKVRLIKKIVEATKLQNGEILVTSMTDPRYVPAMTRAGAIVTDEGGITSHAAIVARELKVPCVIGTKIATSSLRTGDMVEVDATKGFVRKIHSIRRAKSRPQQRVGATKSIVKKL